LYETTWTFGERGWRPACQCPVAPICKHAYAVACAVLDRVHEETGWTDARLPRLVPRQSSAAKPHDPGPAPEHDGEDAEDLQADAGGSRLAHVELADRLADSTTGWERSRILAEALGRPDDQPLDMQWKPIHDLMWETDLELGCWRLAQEWLRLAEPLPA